MPEFKISLARIERVGVGPTPDNIVLTFRFVRGQMNFEVPIALKPTEFDDTEVVQVARSRLSEIFGQLAAQSATWKLPAGAISELRKLNRRPGGR
jgi:hypothetical protein